MSRFHSLFPRLADARAGLVAITPNRRLARALGAAFDAWQVERGERTWETPRILPFSAFVAAQHDAAQHDPALTGVRTPLAAAQEQALWEAVVDASDVALASTTAAARLASEAWSLAHQWRIADRLRHYALTEDTRVFAGWAAEHERRVERLGATDQARLPDNVRELVRDGRLAAPAGLVLVGFDELTPQQHALVQALAEGGTGVERFEPPRAAGTCRRLAALDASAEVDAMADWVAARLAVNPNARIGVVVPDLGARRRAVVRALDAALMPAALLAAPDRARPYTVSFGGALAESPLVAAAMHVLRLAVEDVEFADASALLRSPYIAFGPPAVRARFDFEWRRRAGRRVTLGQLLAAARALRDTDKEGPAAALAALDAWRQRLGPARRRLSEWATLLMDALRVVGFPGERAPDSVEYQTLVRLRELMAEFASLERVEAAVDARGAVRRLARLAAATLFQPEGGDPPVQVLGLLEANGLEFDHLWIAGMTSEGWPLPARAHPLLPLELQRAQRMPGAVVELEHARARALLDRLVGAAPEIVASHAVSDGDRMLKPAPVIAAWSEAAAMPRAPRALDAIVPVALEALPDALGPPLPAHRVVGGGVATLTDQSACAFRAFARHRLGACEPEQPHDGLSASERGELVHRVLASFFQGLPDRTRAGLAALTDAAREAALGQAAAQAIARLRARRLDGPGEGLLALEQRRLVTLARAWLQYELDSRGDFEVRFTEERRALAIGRLSLTGQLDRVDRLPDGRTIVIDYKTGGPASPRAWLGVRPDQPQLPLYLVASEPDARGIAFARLRAGERRFVSLVEEATMLPGARSNDWQREFSDWPALVAAWRSELTRLADDFAAGVAEVEPKGAATCRHCGFATLCRFDERAGEFAAEAAAAQDGDADE